MPQMLSVDSLRTTEKIVWGLSLKMAPNRTIYRKHFVGGQNRQSGCYRKMPSAGSINGGVRQETEQLITRQQRAVSGDV